MKYWTILIITYGAGMLDDSVSYVALPSQDECEVYMGQMFDTLHPKFPDLMIQCKETALPSITIRPQPRPEGLK
jgi:hypothetical protein